MENQIARCVGYPIWHFLLEETLQTKTKFVSLQKIFLRPIGHEVNITPEHPDNFRSDTVEPLGKLAVLAVLGRALNSIIPEENTMKDLLSSRRSIRRFQEKEIESEKLNQIFEAARMSPTWGNLQCQELVIVQAADDKEKLAKLLSKKNPATICTKMAPVVIAVCGNPQKSGYYNSTQVTRYAHWFLYDLGIVSQNICLKAWELGLGSVIVGSFDHRAVEELLEIPKDVELVALIPIGYPDHQPTAPKRKETTDFVHFDRFTVNT